MFVAENGHVHMPTYFGAFGGHFQHLHNLLVQSYLSD